MANKKISDLTAGSALDGTELIEIEQSSTSKRTTPADLKTYMAIKIATIENQQTSGTGGGGLGATNTFKKSPLNTKSDPSSIITSLASNVFQIPAGEYSFEWAVPFYQVDAQSRLRDTTNSTSYLGSSCFGSADVGNSSSIGSTVKITLAGATNFELQVAGVPSGGNDLGRAASQGTEVYGKIRITKYA